MAGSGAVKKPSPWGEGARACRGRMWGIRCLLRGRIPPHQSASLTASAPEGGEANAAQKDSPTSVSCADSFCPRRGRSQCCAEGFPHISHFVTASAPEGGEANATQKDSSTSVSFADSFYPRRGRSQCCAEKSPHISQLLPKGSSLIRFCIYKSDPFGMDDFCKCTTHAHERNRAVCKPKI